MPGRLTNKIAIITGSSSGIGRATALAFASEGASVICSDLREAFRTEYRTDTSDLTTVQAIQALGGQATFVQCNTTSATDMQRLIATAVETYGRIDIMVNNAGISVEGGTPHGRKPVWEFDEAAFETTFDVNVKGVFLGIKYATGQMVKQEPGPSGDRGWIINLASVFGLGGGPGICRLLVYYLLPNSFCSDSFPAPCASPFLHGKLTDWLPSGLRFLQTRRPGPHQSRRLGLRAAPHPRQRAVSRVHGHSLHSRHVPSRRRGTEERSRGSASIPWIGDARGYCAGSGVFGERGCELGYGCGVAGGWGV